MQRVFWFNDITDGEVFKGMCVLEFLNAVRDRYDIPNDEWARMVKEYNLASYIEQNVEDVQDMNSDEYACWMYDFLTGHGEVLHEK
jgi:hypothetical protein